MKYVISERLPATDRTAWSKARYDADSIAQDAGFVPIVVEGIENRAQASIVGKLLGHLSMARRWRRAFQQIPAGASVLLQLPAVSNSLHLARLAATLSRRAQVIGLVHDLESLRMVTDATVPRSRRLRMRVEELGVLHACSRLIVHNEAMATLLKGMNIETLATVLGIFDYLIPEREDGTSWAQAQAHPERDRLVFAGNLSPDKSGFLYELPPCLRMELFGANFRPTESPGVTYHGSFAANDLPAALVGDYGLVWDGPSAVTCTGPYGAYLRYNNPHKLSFFLAMGFPVVVWKQMALAPFVEAHHVGIAVDSIDEVPSRLASIDEAEYQRLLGHAAAVGAALRRGDCLHDALDGHSHFDGKR